MAPTDAIVPHPPPDSNVRTLHDSDPCQPTTDGHGRTIIESGRKRDVYEKGWAVRARTPDLLAVLRACSSQLTNRRYRGELLPGVVHNVETTAPTRT